VSPLVRLTEQSNSVESTTSNAVSQMFVNSENDNDQLIVEAKGRREEPSIRYGIVGSAPLSRNVNSRFPLSIILPSVGHADAVNVELAGENDMESTLAALKMVSKVEAG
jgi:hypothetical protein